MSEVIRISDEAYIKILDILTKRILKENKTISITKVVSEIIMAYEEEE